MLGWIAGMGIGTYMAVAQNMNSSVYALHLFGYVVPAYAAVYALIVNFIVAIVFTLLFRALGVKNGVDQTTSLDYKPATTA